jgi:hypothetical protein
MFNGYANTVNTLLYRAKAFSSTQHTTSEKQLKIRRKVQKKLPNHLHSDLQHFQIKVDKIITSIQQGQYSAPGQNSQCE